MPLSESACRNAKGRERPYKLSDGGGLHLLVQPTGSRLWRMAYRFNGKQKTLAFGVYPVTTLADARDKRLAAKRALQAGKDPAISDAKRAETFEAVARRWFDTFKDGWDESHSGRLFSRLERDAFPHIGNTPINQIRPPAVIDLLRKVEARGAIEVAKRLRQSMSSVFKFAIAEGIMEHNPAADVGAALKPSPRVRHMTTIKAQELPALLRKIEAYDGESITKIGLKLALHTFVRTNELRFGTWSEIEGDIWRIPKERMKMGKEHVVPLTPQSQELLTEAARYREGDYILPGLRGKPISENTLLFSLYRLGYHGRQTVHGFRRLASTILNEHGWPSDHVEMQLAHVPQDRIRGIYNSAEWLEGRKRMLTWWSRYLSEAIQADTSDSRQRTD